MPAWSAMALCVHDFILNTPDKSAVNKGAAFFSEAALSFSDHCIPRFCTPSFNGVIKILVVSVLMELIAVMKTHYK